MKRRDVLLGAAASAVARGAAAQEVPKTAHIGFIATSEVFQPRYFFEVLRRLGWAEGRNLVVESHLTGDDPEQRKTGAAELVARKPDVIVAFGTLDALPVHALTRTIPIVVIAGVDLVDAGLANSLAHPGGNVTGMTVLGGELDSKRLELLPAATQISVLAYAWNPRTIPRITAIEALARPLGIRVAARLVSQAGELDGVFAASAADHDQAMLVQGSPLIIDNKPRVVALAAQYRLPAVYDLRLFTEIGGLAFYGQLGRENFERAAALVDKILKDAKPADLPIEQPTRFELVINLKTAKSLGLTIPPAVLDLANEVIE